jgi:hypothetical protein
VKLLQIKNKTRGVIDKYNKLNAMENDYEKKRYCSFFHQHNNTVAAITVLTSKELKTQRKREGYLGRFLKY